MLPGQNELIGSCNLDDAHKGSISASVGWTFDKRFWGQGYATEAGRALLRLAFERQQVKKVLAECFASNIASRRVMEKLQMRPLTILGGGEMPATANFFTNPHIHYIITRTEWLQQQGAKYEQS
jgi:RimJ/RimL family protein N-acetyltransferase